MQVTHQADIRGDGPRLCHILNLVPSGICLALPQPSSHGEPKTCIDSYTDLLQSCTRSQLHVTACRDSCKGCHKFIETGLKVSKILRLCCLCTCAAVNSHVL